MSSPSRSRFHYLLRVFEKTHVRTAFDRVQRADYHHLADEDSFLLVFAPAIYLPDISILSSPVTSMQDQMVNSESRSIQSPRKKRESSKVPEEPSPEAKLQAETARHGHKTVMVAAIVVAICGLLAPALTTIATRTEVSPPPSSIDTTTNTSSVQPTADSLDGPDGHAASNDTDIPFSVVVRESDDYCRQTWMVPYRATSIVKDQDHPNWIEWADSISAVRANRHLIQFDIQGNSEAAVRIHSIEATLAQPRSMLPGGTEISVGCGGPEGSYQFFSIDLDSDDPLAQPRVEGDASLAEEWGMDVVTVPPQYPIDVAIDDIESFIVVAEISSSEAYWWLSVEWVSGSRSGEYIFGTLGGGEYDQPFHTTSSAGAQYKCAWYEIGDLIQDASSPECPE